MPGVGHLLTKVVKNNMRHAGRRVAGDHFRNEDSPRGGIEMLQEVVSGKLDLLVPPL
jgi:hypothetical protein